MSSEYSGSYANPNLDYSPLNDYYAGSQFGPPLPPTARSQNFPVLMEQSNKKGYQVLSYGRPGQGYYNVASAYGNSCDPKYYVAECPSNKYVRPFVPDIEAVVFPNSSTSVRNELISEGFDYPIIKDLQLHFFFAKNDSNSNKVYNELYKVLRQNLSSTVMLHDIALPENKQLLINLGGTMIPFLFSQKTGNSVTGDIPLNEAIAFLLKEKQVSQEMFSTTPSKTLADVIAGLDINVFVMKGCTYCHKLLDLLQKKGVLHLVKVKDALENRQELNNVSGFPHIVSKNGKSYTGYNDNLDVIVRNLQ